MNDRKRQELTAAKILSTIGLISLSLTLLVSVLYGSGVLSSSCPPDKASGVWSQSIDSALRSLDLSVDSLWMFNSRDGYAMTTAATALLASTSLPMLLVLSIVWFKRRDWLYGVMAIAVSAVLIVAMIR